jgi:hypothetical protein
MQEKLRLLALNCRESCEKDADGLTRQWHWLRQTESAIESRGRGGWRGTWTHLSVLVMDMRLTQWCLSQWQVWHMYFAKASEGPRCCGGRLQPCRWQHLPYSSPKSPDCIQIFDWGHTFDLQSNHVTCGKTFKLWSNICRWASLPSFNNPQLPTPPNPFSLWALSQCPLKRQEA